MSGPCYYYTNLPSSLVRAPGFEPGRTRHKILSLAWLPFHHARILIFGTPGQIRTDTVRILSPLSLPVGIQGQVSLWRSRKDSNPRPSD